MLLSWAMASWRYNRPDEALEATLNGGFPLPWIRNLIEALDPAPPAVKNHGQSHEHQAISVFAMTSMAQLPVMDSRRVQYVRLPNAGTKRSPHEMCGDSMRKNRGQAEL